MPKLTPILSSAPSATIPRIRGPAINNAIPTAPPSRTGHTLITYLIDTVESSTGKACLLGSRVLPPEPQRPSRSLRGFKARF